MKRQSKIFVIASAILGVGIMGAGAALTVTSCTGKETKISEEEAVNAVCDYQLDQTLATFTETEALLTKTVEARPMIGEYAQNGVKLSEIDTDTVVKLFNDLKTTIANHKDKLLAKHWYDYEPADLLQYSLMTLRPLMLPIFQHFAESKLIAFIGGQPFAEAIYAWVDNITSLESTEGHIILKIWAKQNMILRTNVFKGLLNPILQGMNEFFGPIIPDWENLTVWGSIGAFYNDTWYTGINCDHYDLGDVYTEDTSKIDLTKFGDFHPNDFMDHSLDEMSHATAYSQYDWSKVRPGDLMYSANGFQFGEYSTGHMGIITGWAQDVNGYKYLQVIEPNQFGVQYGAIDDERVDKDALSILRVNDASDLQADQALTFAREHVQRQSDYYIALAITKTEDVNSPSWYCSELCWACYKSMGFDIQNYDWGVPYLGCEPGCAPHNIIHSESNIPLIQNHAGKI